MKAEMPKFHQILNVDHGEVRESVASQGWGSLKANRIPAFGRGELLIDISKTSELAPERVAQNSSSG